MSQNKKIVRISTVPLSLKSFCLELFDELHPDYDILAVSSPGEDLDFIEQKGTRVTPVKMERRISPFSDLRSLRRLVKVFRAEKPDLVHSITPKAGLLAMIAARIAKVPVRLHTFTGLVFPTAKGLKRMMLMTTDRLTCACATHIQAEGFGVRADLINCGITSKEVTVLGHGNIRGINLDYYKIDDEMRARAAEMRRHFCIPADAFVFIFVGRVVGDKGIAELIDAFTRLKAEHQKLHLILVGVEEPLEDPLPAHVKECMDSDPAIHFTRSWVSDVRPYYAAADALVFPSYREGFPNVVLEAGAMELPSIVTDINGSREIISSDINGWIVPPRDADSLYKAMLRMVKEPLKYANLRSNAREVIARKFEASAIRAAVKDYYSHILNSVTSK